MSGQRRGKIARLPRSVRDQLNLRLDDGWDAGQILPWLNDLPEVREVLARHFNGASISPQNLSAWRQGGFNEWLLFHQFLESVERAKLTCLRKPQGNVALHRWIAKGTAAADQLQTRPANCQSDQRPTAGADNAGIRAMAGRSSPRCQTTRTNRACLARCLASAPFAAPNPSAIPAAGRARRGKFPAAREHNV
jgi:hypothetical protein